MGEPGVTIERLGKSRLPPDAKKVIPDLVFRHLNPYECVRPGYTLQRWTVADCPMGPSEPIRCSGSKAA